MRALLHGVKVTKNSSSHWLKCLTYCKTDRSVSRQLARYIIVNLSMNFLVTVPREAGILHDCRVPPPKGEGLYHVQSLLTVLVFQSDRSFHTDYVLTAINSKCTPSNSAGLNITVGHGQKPLI